LSGTNTAASATRRPAEADQREPRARAEPGGEEVDAKYYDGSSHYEEGVHPLAIHISRLVSSSKIRRRQRSFSTRPVLLLDLQPPPRRPGLVDAGLVLRDVALVPALDLLPPRLQTTGREPAHWEDEVVAGDDIFELGTAITEPARGEVAAVAVEQVEGLRSGGEATASGSGSSNQLKRDRSYSS
jgi:hypothetical protein